VSTFLGKYCALQSSLCGEHFGCGRAMQHMLQKKRFLSNMGNALRSAWPEIAAVGRILAL